MFPPKQIAPALVFAIFLVAAGIPLRAQSAATAEVSSPAHRWHITDDNALVWNVKPGEAHEDNVEMTGRKASVIVDYGVDAKGALILKEFAIFPTFRTLPHNTRAHVAERFAPDLEPRLRLDHSAPKADVVESVRFKGVLEINGRMTGPNGDVAWTRTVFPSPDKPAIIEIISLKNVSPASVVVSADGGTKTVTTDPAKSADGAACVVSSRMPEDRERTLKAGESTEFVRILSARRKDQPEWNIDAPAELRARRTLVDGYRGKLQLVTPSKVLDTMFAFAKIRAAESIILTKNGLMHAPGGGRYYAAIWANDQGEYAPPFFPFLGDTDANRASANAFRLFAIYMNPDYRPIPYAIVAEGATTRHDADRGDMAMLAYGAARFALASGDRALAGQQWPLIEWCLEYCRRRTNKDGVVESDSDELENRLPAGKANLCTSSLYYDALLSAVDLGRALGKPEARLQRYAAQAKRVRAAIESYFGANVEGFATYRYFDRSVPSVDEGALRRHAHVAKEPDRLRAWICIPLTVGILDRAQGTLDALFSPKLWLPDGLATQAGDKSFWDRSTLYALRGAFAAGDTARALHHLEAYSTRRLLGDHVPYAVEAFPEGNQSHLAAESALYGRIFTEGLFGIRPTGLHSFTCTPRLPAEWPQMELRNIRAFGGDFDLTVTRAEKRLQIQVSGRGIAPQRLEIADGETATIDLKTD